MRRCRWSGLVLIVSARPAPQNLLCPSPKLSPPFNCDDPLSVMTLSGVVVIVLVLILQGQPRLDRRRPLKCLSHRLGLQPPHAQARYRRAGDATATPGPQQAIGPSASPTGSTTAAVAEGESGGGRHDNESKHRALFTTTTSIKFKYYNIIRIISIYLC